VSNLELAEVDREVDVEERRCDDEIGELITDDDAAVRVAKQLVLSVVGGGADRGALRSQPAGALELVRRSGLLAMTVPRSHGGVEVSANTLTEVVGLLASADPCAAEVLHSHLTFVDSLRRRATEPQRARYFSQVVAGRYLAAARVGRSGVGSQEGTTVIAPRSGTDGFALSASGVHRVDVADARLLVVQAVVRAGPDRSDRRPTAFLVFVDADGPGVSVVDAPDGGRPGEPGSLFDLAAAPVRLDQVVPFDPGHRRSRARLTSRAHAPVGPPVSSSSGPR
jgi:alkylation response protein AidB-like acyl-CoA dehydrogenase